MSEHLTLELLRQIRSGEREASDLAAAALGHLLDICPACRRAVEAWRQHAAAEGDGFRGAVALGPQPTPRPPEDSRDWLDDLLRLSPIEWPSRVRDSLGTQTASLAKELLTRIRDLLPSDPARAHSLASLACLILRHASSTPEAAALYALSLAHQANATRVQENLVQAQELMSAARFILRTGCREEEDCDPLVLAEVDGLEGSLRRSQRRLDEAGFLLRRATRTCLEHGSTIEAAKRLIALGPVYQGQGAYARKDQALRRACELLERTNAPPKFLLMGLHGRAHLFACRKRPREARRLFGTIDDLYQEIQDAAVRLRRTWLDALIFQSEGNLNRAEDRFLEAREGFLAEERPYTAAIVCKDLVALYMEQGRVRDVKPIVEEIIPVFEAHEVPFEARAAQKILRDTFGGHRNVN